MLLFVDHVKRRGDHRAATKNNKTRACSVRILKLALCRAPHACMAMQLARSRRGYQDYSSWQNFGTASMWQEISATPQLAGELIARQLSQLKLRNPSEKTSADVTAGILAAMHNNAGVVVSQPQINSMFDWFKARQRACIIFCMRVRFIAVTTACIVMMIFTQLI